jgi:hypothetical protein
MIKITIKTFSPNHRIPYKYEYYQKYLSNLKIVINNLVLLKKIQKILTKII